MKANLISHEKGREIMFVMQNQYKIKNPILCIWHFNTLLLGSSF